MSCDVEALEVGANIREVEPAIAPIERGSLGSPLELSKQRGLDWTACQGKE